MQWPALAPLAAERPRIAELAALCEGWDGRRVRTLARAVQDAGRYHFTWNGTDERGAVVGSGLYFVRLDAASTRKTRLMTLIR